MRRYDIVTGILLILSIIDFALAVPVLAEEKHQARVDVVHVPKDLTTVLGKRWEEELENLGEEYFKTSGKPIDSSGTHSSSSTVPSGPGYGSTVAVQSPAPNLASSAATGNPGPLKDSPCSQLCSSTTSSMKGLSARGMGSCFTCIRWWAEWWDDYTGSRRRPPQRHVTGTVPMADTSPQPNPNARPPTNPPVAPDFGYVDRLIYAEDPPPLPPLDPPPLNPDHQSNEAIHPPERHQITMTRPSMPPQLNPSAEPDSDYLDQMINAPHSLQLRPVSPKEDSGEGSALPGATLPPDQEPEVLRPSSSSIPVSHPGQSSSVASQPVDPLAAVNAMKGKAKESGRTSEIVSDASDDASR